MMTQSDFSNAVTAAGLKVPGQHIEFHGSDPVFPSPLKLATGIASAMAMVGSVIDDIWSHGSGRHQAIAVDLTHAALFLSSSWLLKLDGAAATSLDNLGPLPTEGIFQCADGHWLQISSVFPELTRGTLDVLDCDASPEAVRQAISCWHSEDLEKALTSKDLAGVVIRTEQEWLEHPQGLVMKDVPVIELERIGDAPPIPLPVGERPLSGLKVMDLTRVLAGPTVSRTLAEFGADVLQINAPHLPDLMSCQADTGHGKRRAWLDLNNPEAVATAWALAGTADVFSQSFRSGHLAQRGFSPQRLADRRPGIIYVSENCYGHRGPWQSKRGYDSSVRAASGVLRVHGKPTDSPDPERLHFAMHDYATGCWGAYGVLLAMKKRATEGGSWHVKISLNQTARWFMRMGTPCNPDAAPSADELRSAFGRYAESVASSYGQMQRLKPVLHMSDTPPVWQSETARPGEHDATWIS